MPIMISTARITDDNSAAYFSTARTTAEVHVVAMPARLSSKVHACGYYGYQLYIGAWSYMVSVHTRYSYPLHGVPYSPQIIYTSKPLVATVVSYAVTITHQRSRAELE